MGDTASPRVTLTLTRAQVESLFAQLDLSALAVRAFDAGDWKPRPIDALPAATIGRVLKGASLEREMKALATWLRDQEREKK